MKSAQLYSTVVVLCFQLSIALRFRDRPSELILMNLSTRIFSHEIFFFNQSTACLSPSAKYSQGISKPFPAPLFTLFLVILQLILLFGNRRNRRHSQAETFWHMTNNKPIFYCCNGTFIFNIFWLSSTHNTFFSHWPPYFLVHMTTTNIRFESEIFCPFVNHFLFTSDCIASVRKTDIYEVSVQWFQYHNLSNFGRLTPYNVCSVLRRLFSTAEAVQYCGG